MVYRLSADLVRNRFCATGRRRFPSRVYGQSWIGTPSRSGGFPRVYHTARDRCEPSVLTAARRSGPYRRRGSRNGNGPADRASREQESRGLIVRPFRQDRHLCHLRRHEVPPYRAQPDGGNSGTRRSRVALRKGRQHTIRQTRAAAAFPSVIGICATFGVVMK
jgi:hypothetical protein